MSIRRSLFLLLVLAPAVFGGAATAPPPPYRQTAVLSPADGRDFDFFGTAIAAAGEFVAIGAPGRDNHQDYGSGDADDGAVYLFRRGPDGWTAASIIEPPGAVRDSWFGGALAFDGDTLAVGAPSAGASRSGRAGDATATGAVFVFSAASGQLQATLVPDDPLEFALYGAALALDGDTLIATAQPPDRAAKAATVYIRQGNSWQPQATLTNPDGPYRDFGAAVAVSGDVALIGAPGDINDPAPFDRGVVYVYARGGGVWSAAGMLVPDDGQSGDNFGCAVELAGQTAVVAACAYQPETNPPNRAYVFSPDNGIWTQRAHLTPTDGAFPVAIDALAFDGDRVLIGARDPYDWLAQPGGGRAFLFERDGAGWRQTQVLRPAGAEAYDSYVTAVELTGSEALVTAIGDSWLNAPRHGLGYVFAPQPPGGGLAYLPAVFCPALAQRTGLIAYVRSVAGSAPDIYLIQPNGGGQTNLTRTPAIEYDPAWSPDGRRLVFVRSEATFPTLVILDVVTGAEQIIPAPGANTIYHPTWSPDGRFIAYHGFRGGATDVFRVAVEGGDPINLTQTADQSESFPDWSPDGTRLAYIRQTLLATMNPDGGDVTLVDGALGEALSPDWSPDGETILYTVNTASGFVLHTIPAEGGASQFVIRHAQYARWSPDGAQIIFTGAGWGIFRIDADGRGLSVVDGSQFARMADWQP